MLGTPIWAVWTTLCSRTRGVLQAEGRVGIGQGQGDSEPQASVVVELEAAGGSWKAMLLAVLSQLSMLLALRSGGAAGIWRHWKRERRRRRNNVIKGGRGGTAVQQWWMQLCSIAHQDRCGHRGRDRRRDSGNQMRAELEVQNSEGAGVGGSTPVRSSGRSSVSRSACWCRGHNVLVLVEYPP